MTLPTSRPHLTREAAVKLIDQGPAPSGLWVLGLRGYYKRSMGDPAKNDRGIYDDAIVVVSPRVYATFNANVDPSPWGVNPRTGKGYAMLTAGLWHYQMGWHKKGKPGGHRALVQARAVTVDRRLRDGDPSILDTGWFGLNIHRGGATRPGSEGCQTIPPGQWDAFLAAVQLALAEAPGAVTVRYLLLA